MTVISDLMLIPYGTDSWSVQGLEIQHFTNRALTLDARFPCAAINRLSKSAFTLSSEPFEQPMGPDGQGVAPLKAVENDIRRHCRTWDVLAQRFVAGYFVHIEAMLDRHRSIIEEKTAPFVGLYKVADWAFSAPKPLPRAHLYAPLDAGVPWSIEDYVQVDFAVWLGTRMVAAVSRSGGMTPSKARSRMERLESAGIDAVQFDMAGLADGQAEVYERLIGDFGELVRRAGPVPVAPFWPKTLMVR